MLMRCKGKTEEAPGKKSSNLPLQGQWWELSFLIVNTGSGCGHCFKYSKRQHYVHCFIVSSSQISAAAAIPVGWTFTLKSYRWQPEPQNVTILRIEALMSLIKENEAFDLTTAFTKKPGTQSQEVAICKSGDLGSRSCQNLTPGPPDPRALRRE